MLNDLKSYDIFRPVEDAELLALMASRQIVCQSYSRARTLHEQGSVCQGLHLICSGKLVAYSLAPNGSETVVFEFGKGDVIGANFLFGEDKTYPMNVFCMTDARIFFVSREAVLQLLKNYGFTLAFVKALSSNAQRMNRKIAIYVRGSLKDNLKDYFLALAADQGTETILLPISKKELADYLGVQRPSLFRELKRMKDEGLIAVHNREIRLLGLLGQAHT